MKFGYNEVLEVTVFDDLGKLVTTLDTLKSSYLRIDAGGKASLFVEDALLDDKLLKFINKSEENTATDFDTYVKKQKYGTTITFNKSINKDCKVVGRGIMRKADDGVDKEFIFEIPKAEIGQGFNFGTDSSNTEISVFGYKFSPKEYNESGDLFKMHIE